MKVYESVWKWTFIYESIWKNLNFYESIWNCMKVHAFKYFNLYTYTSIRKKLILFLERYRKQYDPIITFKKRQWRGTKISECSIKESTMVIFTGSEILEMGLAKKFSKAWSIKSVRAWIHSVNWMIRSNKLAPIHGSSLEATSRQCCPGPFPFDWATHGPTRHEGFWMNPRCRNHRTRATIPKK